MADFKIRRGLSTALFSEPGVVNPRLVIEEGCWYLCTDTAELFLGVLTDGTLELKRINGDHISAEDRPTNTPSSGVTGGGNGGGTDDDSAIADIEHAVGVIMSELEALKQVELFQKINSETDLPSNFEAEDFNGNIVYYLPLENNKVSLFVYDKTAKCYLCSNSVDELVVRAMVTDAIDSTLDAALEAKLPSAIAQTIESAILYGGNATFNN